MYNVAKHRFAGAPDGAGSWWEAIRLPVAGVAVAALAIGLAYVLDTQTVAQHDAALLIGSVALYGLLPVSLVWLIGTAAVYAARRRRR